MASWQTLIDYVITMYNPQLDEKVHYEEIEWDRSDYGPCDPCAVRISDLGLYQCDNCLGLLTLKAVKHSLACNYGEFWHEEYENLKRIRRNLANGKFDRLDTTYLGLRHNNGEIKTYRRFYDLKPAD